jgi:serine/threonine protein kinase
MKMTDYEWKSPGTIVHGTYVIERVLGAGGLGVTYLVSDRLNNRKVALKEQKCVADNAYMETVQRVIRLEKIEGLAQIYDIFIEEEHTYLVMEYVEGINGVQYLENDSYTKEAKNVLQMILPIVAAISKLHSVKVIHRDISTDNLIIDTTGKAVLVDFDLLHDNSQGFSANDTSFVKNGFSPLELYLAGGKQGIWTDMYELCATIYHLLTGVVISNAGQRQNGEKIPSLSTYNLPLKAQTMDYIMQGLELQIEQRFSNTDILYHMLQGECEGDVQQQSVQPLAEPYVAMEEMRTLKSNEQKKESEVVSIKAETSINAGDGKKEKKKFRSKGKKVLIAFGIIVVATLILGISIAFYVNTNKEEEDNEKVSSTEEVLKEMRQEAEKARQEQYEKAVELAEGSYSSYSEGKTAYDQAVRIFEELGDYEDSYQQLYNIAAIYENYYYYEEAIGVYQYLDDFLDSQEKLFDYGDYYISLRDYTTAQAIYEELGDAESADGTKASDNVDRCVFLNLYADYVQDGYYSDVSVLDNLISGFGEMGDYYNEDHEISAKDMTSTCEYQRAVMYVRNGMVSNFSDVQSLLVERQDYDTLYSMAKKYEEAFDYLSAEDIYKILASETGKSYENEIRECQANIFMQDKYANFDMDNSMAYDSIVESMVPYVSADTAENILEHCYADFTDDAGTTLTIGKTEINSRKYGIKSIEAYDTAGTNFTAVIYYLDAPDVTLKLEYQSGLTRMITDEWGNEWTEKYDQLTLDNHVYEL